MKFAQPPPNCKCIDDERVRAAPKSLTDSPRALPKEFISLGDALRLAVAQWGVGK